MKPINAAFSAFRKALIEGAMGAELGHHQGYPAGATQFDAVSSARFG